MSAAADSIWKLAILIAIGVIIANLIINPSAASTLFGYVEGVYKWAVKSMMGGNQ
jgi:hypothetical protein